MVETIDYTKGYNALVKKLNSIAKRLRNTDSIKEYDKLEVQKRNLYRKINAIQELGEYHAEDFEE